MQPPFIAHFDVARIKPDLDRLAGRRRNRIEIGPHPHAAQPIHARKRDLRQLEALLGQRQQMRALLDHRRAHRLLCPAIWRRSSSRQAASSCALRSSRSRAFGSGTQ